ncbi:MAG: MFS transporter [Elusimicrobiota bacterium]
MRNKIRNSLKYSFWDGSFAAMMLGFGDVFISPFAIALKASNMQIGLLSSLPGLVSSLFQIKIPDWTEKTGRKRMLFIWIFAQASMWLVILLIPYIFGVPVPYLIGAVMLYVLFGSLAGPAWVSMMTQYLPKDKRGQYFSWRYKIHGTITLIMTFVAGYILYLFPKESITGFTIIFAVAMISRLVSWYFINKMHEIPLRMKPDSYFSFYDFIARAKKSNFAKFVFFVGCMSLAVNMAAPFFSVYMLRELKLDYLSFTVINTVVMISMLLSFQRWGHYTDKLGCIRVISLTSLIIPVIPVMWLFSHNLLYLISIQVISGFAWAGFNLAASNFIFDAASEEKRVRCFAYFNLINGLGVFLGAAMGGTMIAYLPKINGSSLLTIFLISGLLRFIIRFVFIPHLKEVKPVESCSNMELFNRAIGLKPATGAVHGAFKNE